MEVLHMDEKELTKTELWTKRVQDFHNSGLSRKEWCQEHQVSLSTLSYWIRKQAKGFIESEQIMDPVFARLPSKQEISSNLRSEHAPVTVYLPGSVRIEIGMECPHELMTSLIHTLKTYA